MKKNILVAVTGSIAIDKAVIAINKLQEQHNVRVIVSEYVEKNWPNIDKLEYEKIPTLLENNPDHILINDWADHVIVLPATANTISKFAAVIADTPFMSTLIAAQSKVIFVPAMNTHMYQRLIDSEIISKLESQGHFFIGPTVGKLKTGAIGLGRMLEPDEIVESINGIIDPNGKTVLVSYGASKVYIDDIRFITNGSSGEMGKSILRELRLKGFNPIPFEISELTNQEVFEYIKSTNFDVYISVAAFSDFKFDQRVEGKISKSENDSLNITLTKNIDVLSLVRNEFPNKKIIGFKHDNNKEKAIKKLNDLSLDSIVWNTIGSMGKGNITGEIISSGDSIPFENIDKKQLAKMIVDNI